MDNLEVVTIEARIPKVVDITIPTNGIIGAGYIAGPAGRDGRDGLTGPEGPRGPQGIPGPKGNAFTYEDFTPEQLEALKGPRGADGDIGPMGPRGMQGEPGKDGKPFTYDMFTQEQLVALKGPKGDTGLQGPKGEPFRFEDFTPEQLEKLKGPAGTGGNVDLSAYTTKKDADNLYLKKVDLRNYLTMIGDPKYALKTELSSYLKSEVASNYYVTKLFAENTYATKTSIENYISKTAASNTYVSKIFAENTYATKTNLNDYMKTAAANSVFLSKISAENTYVSKANAETSYSKKSELNDYVKKSEINQYTSSANVQLTPEQIEKLRGPKGDPGDNVNLETVAKIKNLLLDNNVCVHSDSLEGILLEYFEAQRNSTTIYLIGDEGIADPYITVSEGKINIQYGVTLPFQINDGEIQYMSMQNISVHLPSTTENTTIKFYSARMKLMYTKVIEVL